MKEIKAYIRREKAERVVDELRRNGAPEVNLLEVHAVGYGEEPNFFVESDDVFSRYSLHMVKVEIVCTDDREPWLVELLREAAHSGYKGDGMIFVAQVQRAVRVRDAAEGEQAL